MWCYMESIDHSMLTTWSQYDSLNSAAFFLYLTFPHHIYESEYTYIRDHYIDFVLTKNFHVDIDPR